MSLLFFKRVLANPLQVGYLVPSSPFLTRQTAKRLNFSKPRVIVELGPGEGCHTRQIVRRMTDDCRLVAFELDPEFCDHLKKQFKDDPRVTILHRNALELPQTLEEMGVTHCDYIVSGLPFLVIEEQARNKLLGNISQAIGTEGRFITYQVTMQIADHDHLFELADKEYCPLNLPPINVLEFKQAKSKQKVAA